SHAPLARAPSLPSLLRGAHSIPRIATTAPAPPRWNHSPLGPGHTPAPPAHRHSPDLRCPNTAGRGFRPRCRYGDDGWDGGRSSLPAPDWRTRRCGVAHILRGGGRGTSAPHPYLYSWPGSYGDARLPYPFAC